MCNPLHRQLATCVPCVYLKVMIESIKYPEVRNIMQVDGGGQGPSADYVRIFTAI